MPKVKGSVRFSPKHRWEDTDRMELILLELCFEDGPKNIAAIFNYLHRHQLLREGFIRGIPTHSISAQLHEYKHGGVGSRLFTAISMLSLSQLNIFFADRIDIIRDAAQRLRIELSPKQVTETRRLPILNVPRHLGPETLMTETSVTTWIPDSGDSELEDLVTPTKQGIKFHDFDSDTRNQQPKEYLSPMISPRFKGAHRHPMFLYRAFELDHGLKARRFVGVDRDGIPGPPRYKSRSFATVVQPHLARDQTYASPFVSLAQNPKVAVKHAFNKMTAGTTIALAIFKYDDLKTDATKRYGPESGPYLVPMICRQHSLRDLPGEYEGFGEFLVWGSIECEPVAVISEVDTLMIRAILRSTRKIDFDAGVRLSEYLPRLSNSQYLELFLYQLIVGFKVNGYDLARKSTAYFEFVRGATTMPESSEEMEVDDTMSDIEDDCYVLEVTPKKRSKIERFASIAWRDDSD